MAGPPDIRPGDEITADWLNRAKNAGVQRVVGTGSIAVNQSGGRVVVTDRKQTAGIKYDAKKKVKLTARGSTEGEFEFEEVEWDKENGKFKVKTDGVTHLDFGLARATGEQIEGGSGFAYVGDIVTIRPGLKDRGEELPRVSWEFTPDCKIMHVTVTGSGFAGDDDNPCEFVYDVFAQDGEQLLSGVSPTNQRTQNGERVAGTEGYVYYKLVAGVPAVTLGWVNEEYVRPAAGAADGQGYETVTTGATTLNKTDGGVLEFVAASPSAGELAVEFAQNNNDPTAEISAVVDVSGLEVGGVGGSGGATIWSKLIRVPSGTATGVRTLDSDDYSGRNLMILFHPPFQGTQAAFDDDSSGLTPLGRRIGAAETTDNVIQSATGFSVFIDVSDGHKLKIDITSVPGADRWFQLTILKGARKTTPDITIT